MKTIFRRSDDLDVAVAASGFTKDLAAQFDEAAAEINILGGPDDPKEEDEGEDDDSMEEEEEEEIEETDDVGDCDENGETDVKPEAEVQSAVLTDPECEQAEKKHDFEREENVSKNVTENSLNKNDSECETDKDEHGIANEEVAKEVIGSDSEGEMCDISGQNRSYRPFRNEASVQHVNTHVLKARARNSNSVSSNFSTSSIAPDVIREKVKRQRKKLADQLQARRIRKSGEASLQTKLRRDVEMDIRQSTSEEWF